jgi:hypothetical protein
MARDHRQSASDRRASHEGRDGQQRQERRGASDGWGCAEGDEAAGDLGDEEAEQCDERASIDVSGDVPEGERQQPADSRRRLSVPIMAISHPPL